MAFPYQLRIGENSKLRPVTKHDKRNRTMSKKLTMTSCQYIMTSSSSFFWFTTKFEESWSRIPWSAIWLRDCSKLVVNQKNDDDDDVIICWHEVIVNFLDVVVFLLSSMVRNFYIFFNSYLLSNKNWKQLKKVNQM